MQKISNHKLEIKSLSENGNFSGYASMYSVIDSYNDIILPGAFGSIETASSVKLLWQHDPQIPIGVLNKIEETSLGLYIEAKILTTIEKGREAYELLKANIIDGLSIGFETLSYRVVGEYRHITKLKLWEVSVVTFPANEAARISDVSSISNMGIEARFLKSLDRAIKILH